MKTLWIVAALIACAANAAPPLVLPPHFTATDLIETGLSLPTAMEFAPDGRLFITQQTGEVRIVKDGALLPTPFVTVQTQAIVERGLVGLAIDPDFNTNHYIYIYYAALQPTIHNRISRFTADGDTVDPTTEVVLMDLEDLDAPVHNGGAMHFGPDGKLYVGVGDNFVGGRAQWLDTRMGKILRINSDGTIPADNPFNDKTTGDNRAIWAMGLRNPFTLAFQPGTGRLYINDVGEASWEEVNEGAAGANYGWADVEGPGTDPKFTNPIFAYPHQGDQNESGCAIAGGTFYNPATAMFPTQYVGKYFFSDVCNGWIKTLDPDTHDVELFSSNNWRTQVDLDVAPDGSLYLLQFGNVGRLTRIVYTPPPYTMEDARQALQIAAGLTEGGAPDISKLNVATDGDSADVIDLSDAVELVRRAAQ